jgi:hypothetical protein
MPGPVNSSTKDLIVGFKGIHIAPVTTHTATEYETEAAYELPYAGSMTMTDKLTEQDLYYDDAVYYSMKDMRGRDAEIRMAQVSFEWLETLGLGTYDATTGTFHANMNVTGKEYSLRFIADTVAHNPFYFKFRSFQVTGLKLGDFTTLSNTATANDWIMTGTVTECRTVGLTYMDMMQLADDKSNLAACTAFISGAETFPDAG